MKQVARVKRISLIEDVLKDEKDNVSSGEVETFRVGP